MQPHTCQYPLLLLLLLLLLPHRSSHQQYWFERFPAAAGAAATTYMFAFTDPAPENKDMLKQMMEKYYEQLPEYIGKLSAHNCCDHVQYRYEFLITFVVCYV